MLSRCLDSLKGVDEIIIVDTGSKDTTKSIAAKYTDKIFDFPWNDSFCDARNEAKSHATGDWIISIDADEYLNDLDEVKKAIEVAEKEKAVAINIRMVAEDNGQWFYYPRIFKNTPEVFWVGNIHNHLSKTGIDCGDKVRITHGYSPAHQLDPERSLRILEKDVMTNGGPREMFYLGREYFYRGEHQRAVKMLGQYVQRSRYLAEKADAFLIMSRAYWAMSMPDDARDAVAQALIINSNFKEAILFMAKLAGDGSGNPRWEENARQWKMMAKTATNADVLFVRGKI